MCLCTDYLEIMVENSKKFVKKKKQFLYYTLVLMVLVQVECCHRRCTTLQCSAEIPKLNIILLHK